MLCASQQFFDSDANAVAGAASGDTAASALCIEYVVIGEGGALHAPIEVHEKIHTAFGLDWLYNICYYSCLFLNVQKKCSIIQVWQFQCTFSSYNFPIVWRLIQMNRWMDGWTND